MADPSLADLDAFAAVARAPSTAAGRLVPVLAEWWPMFPGPSLYCPSRRHMPAPLHAFVDVLREPGSRWDGVPG
jgi:DNA-binding transcriptional LysR family regulator